MQPIYRANPFITASGNGRGRTNAYISGSSVDVGADMGTISEALIKHVEDRLGHDRRYGIDPTKIKEELGWYPETPFEVGIVKTIDWYLENEEWMNRVTSGAYQSYYAEMYKNRQ